MKATEKQHALRRINSTAAALKGALTTLEKPDLQKHLITAIMDAKVALLPAKQVTQAARLVIGASSYRTCRVLNFEAVFAPPASYVKALAAYDAEQKATEKRRKAVEREAQRITDAIEFGRITDPAEAIAQLEQFKA